MTDRMKRLIDLKTIVNECDIALDSYRTLPPGIELAKLLKKSAIEDMKNMVRGQTND